MGFKQIRRDYKNIDYLDGKGKVKTRVEYIGKYYKPDDDKEYKTHKNKVTVFSFILFALYVASMIVYSGAMKAMYFALPFAGLIFPLFFYLINVYKLHFKKMPLRQEDYDSMFSTFKIWCVSGVVLGLAASIGYVIKMVTEGVSTIDILPVSAVFLFLIFSVLIFRSIVKTKINTVGEEKKFISGNK